MGVFTVDSGGLRPFCRVLSQGNMMRVGPDGEGRRPRRAAVRWEKMGSLDPGGRCCWAGGAPLAGLRRRLECSCAAQFMLPLYQGTPMGRDVLSGLSPPGLQGDEKGCLAYEGRGEGPTIGPAAPGCSLASFRKSQE